MHTSSSGVPPQHATRVAYPDTACLNRLQDRLIAAIDDNDLSEIDSLLPDAEQPTGLDFAALFDQCYSRPGVDQAIKIAIARKALAQGRENQSHHKAPDQRFSFVSPLHLQLIVKNDERKLAKLFLRYGFPVSRFPISRNDRRQPWRELLKKYEAIQNAKPYLSKREVKNFNGEVLFTEGPSKRKEMLCRHLAWLYLKLFGQTQADKADLSLFGSKEAIAKHMPLDAEEQFKLFISTAKENYLIDNDGFGEFLVDQFESMEKNNKTARGMMLLSTDHAMDVVLKIKEGDDGRKEYVVLFYDPNITTSQRRFPTSDPTRLASQRLKDYLPSTDPCDENFYYPEQARVSLISIFDENAEPGAQATRTLNNLSRQISPTVVWFLLSYVHAEALKDLLPSIRLISDNLQAHPGAVAQDNFLNLLAAKNPDGLPGLYVALSQGHADAIRAYGELLALLPEEQKATLLPQLLNPENKAYIRGNRITVAKTHQAYNELLALFPQTQTPTMRE